MVVIEGIELDDYYSIHKPYTIDDPYGGDSLTADLNVYYEVSTVPIRNIYLFLC
jgi:hypothetical protein